MNHTLPYRMRALAAMLTHPVGVTADEMKDSGFPSPWAMMRDLEKRGALIISEPAFPGSAHIRLARRPKLRYRLVAWSWTP